MKRLQALQLTPKIHFVGHSPLWLHALGNVLLLIVIFWMGYGLWLARLQHIQMDALQQKITQAEIEFSNATAIVTIQPPIKATTDAASLSNSASWSPEQRRQINGVIRQLNTPWLDLFEQLEKTTPKNVALISIESDARQSSLRLQAEAKSLDTLLTFASSLQNQNTLGHLTYSKHETNDQDPNKPIRLTVEFSLQKPARLQVAAISAGAQK